MDGALGGAAEGVEMGLAELASEKRPRFAYIRLNSGTSERFLLTKRA